MKALRTIVVVILLLPCGCGGPNLVPVKGVAIRNGQPVPYLLITFHPEDGGRPSWARTDEQGRFTLNYDRGHNGATPGTYRVTVDFPPRNPQEEADRSLGKVTLDSVQLAILEKYGPRGQPVTVQITQATADLELKLD